MYLGQFYSICAWGTKPLHIFDSTSSHIQSQCWRSDWINRVPIICSSFFWIFPLPVIGKPSGIPLHSIQKIWLGHLWAPSRSRTRKATSRSDGRGVSSRCDDLTHNLVTESNYWHAWHGRVLKQAVFNFCRVYIFPSCSVVLAMNLQLTYFRYDLLTLYNYIFDSASIFKLPLTIHHRLVTRSHPHCPWFIRDHLVIGFLDIFVISSLQ